MRFKNRLSVSSFLPTPNFHMCQNPEKNRVLNWPPPEMTKCRTCHPLSKEKSIMKESPHQHPAPCCPYCSPNSVIFARFPPERHLNHGSIPTQHSALCCPVPYLVHLDCVLQVPPFQPHQPSQKKTNPAQSNPKFRLQPLMLPLFCFCFQDHFALDLLCFMYFE